MQLHTHKIHNQLLHISIYQKYLKINHSKYKEKKPRATQFTWLSKAKNKKRRPSYTENTQSTASEKSRVFDNITNIKDY